MRENKRTLRRRQTNYSSVSLLARRVSKLRVFPKKDVLPEFLKVVRERRIKTHFFLYTLGCATYRP